MTCPMCGAPLVDDACRDHGRFSAGVPVPKIVSPFTAPVGLDRRLRQAALSTIVILLIMLAYLLLRIALGEQ